MKTHTSKFTARVTEGLVRQNTIALLTKRQAEVKAEMALYQAQAERQLAAYTAVINEHDRLIKQLTTPTKEAS